MMPRIRDSTWMRDPSSTNILEPWVRQARSDTGNVSVSLTRPSNRTPLAPKGRHPSDSHSSFEVAMAFNAIYLNPIFQARRHLNLTHGSLEPRAHIPSLLRFPRARRAPLEVLHQLETTLREQFIVDVRV